MFWANLRWIKIISWFKKIKVAQGESQYTVLLHV